MNNYLSGAGLFFGFVAALYMATEIWPEKEYKATDEKLEKARKAKAEAEKAGKKR